jgi:hypothetical protein
MPHDPTRIYYGDKLNNFANAPLTITDNPDSATRRVTAYNNSYSGSDIQCMMFMPRYTPEEQEAIPEKLKELREMTTYKIFAELQTITVSSHRNVFPVRRLGESHAFKYTRGARTIAGTLVFSVLNQDVMADFYRRHAGEVDNSGPFFVDQIPPFSITAIAENEYGGVASAILVNVSLTNFGQTISVDDIFMESTYSYVAEMYLPFVDNPREFLRRLELEYKGPMDQPFSKVWKPDGYMLGGKRGEDYQRDEEERIVDQVMQERTRFTI